MVKSARTRDEMLMELYGGTYSLDEVTRLMRVGRNRVIAFAMREDDPLPFRFFPGASRGAFVTRDDLLDWLDRNSLTFRKVRTKQK